MPLRQTRIAATLLLSLLSCTPLFADEAESEALTFEKHIRPIFRAHCFDCHGATEMVEGELDLRLVRFLTKGGESGPAIEPGKPDASFLLERIESGEMPPGEAKVSAKETEIIRRWIAAGAPVARPEPESIGPGLGITAEERSYWAFQPIRRPTINPVAEYSTDMRIRTELDAVVFESTQQQFAADADRRTLILRSFFALTGLPPEPDQLTRWLTLEADNWHEQLIDELLESPHYGERWARHWLDVAGYADSEGYTVRDTVRSWAWRYRDWVVRAINEDKPLDQFLVEQLAGDELAGPRDGDLTPKQIELLTATGFLRMAADGTGSDNSLISRNQVMSDTLKIVGSSLLGLSVHCAACHDHRYDPIPQTDYYALRAVFEPALDYRSWKTPNARRISLYTAADRAKSAEIDKEVQQIQTEKNAKQAEFMKQALEKELNKFPAPLRDQLREAVDTPADKRSEEQKKLLAANPSIIISPGVLYQYLPKAAEELKEFDARMSKTRAKKPAESFVRALIEPSNHIPETRLFHRGDHEQPKQKILPGALSVLRGAEGRLEFSENDSKFPTTGRRTAFARWLVSSDNPLTPRVLVNRIWMHHFGKGLAPTPGELGRLGAPPTHPQVLDWLADELVRRGWSMKQLHRVIMTSTVWRQARDPASPFRPSLQRLEAEAIRDRVLTVSGRLDRTLFGAPIGIKEDDAGQVHVADGKPRRSLYVQVRRSRPVAMLQAFDSPVMETNCERRERSTVATQALLMLNGKFFLDGAAALAERAAKELERLDGDVLAKLPSIPQLSESPWDYGYGVFDKTTKRTASFQRLPHWTGSQWQGGEKLPDKQLGWVLLHATGGHPASSHAAIRRFTAKHDGQLRIEGDLSHGSPEGDGVRGRLVSSRHGLLAEWQAHNGAAKTHVAKLDVKQGDTIDFITDCKGSVGFDSFRWPVVVHFSHDDKTEKLAAAEAFAGPSESPQQLLEQAARAWRLALCRPPSGDELKLTAEHLSRQVAFLKQHPKSCVNGRTAYRQALVNYCQVLLGSNEFLYVE